MNIRGVEYSREISHVSTDKSIDLLSSHDQNLGQKPYKNPFLDRFQIIIYRGSLLVLNIVLFLYKLLLIILFQVLFKYLSFAEVTCDNQRNQEALYSPFVPFTILLNFILVFKVVQLSIQLFKYLNIIVLQQHVLQLPYFLFQDISCNNSFLLLYILLLFE